ncbi:hypothetical protein MHI43_15745 [Paenibacillus sp. FSL H8-0457]|uniref:hypothetical protein n=1 Tax=unclassified Paenibacillus TaxID=185978 RepID=UPI0001789C89|nr:MULTISPECIES: hypothetical protein [unclassified Paenibacillus]ACX65333.1 hypothetical protein GYMC10_3071 [Paenibacillus sp. Y412MC10]ETT62835.1 hypothetical protein C172_16206 [Paenibacillus sp. FSL H8-457]
MKPLNKQNVYSSFKELNMLEQLEEELRAELGIDFWETIGIGFDYWPEDDNADYEWESMPIDMVLLGSTVISECTFGFLTEFSTVDDLSNAPIIQHEAIGLDKHSTLIAHNFIDFLRLLITTKSIFGLMSEEDVELEGDLEPTVELIFNRIQERFQIEPFESISAYKQQLMQEREKHIVVQTFNRIGVKRVTDHFTHQKVDLDYVESDEQMEERLLTFVNSTSLENVLAFVRDVQETNYIEVPFPEKIRVAVKSLLQEHGFVNELRHLDTLYKTNN